MPNTPWIGSADDKLYLQSGQFTSTLKTSQSIGSIDNTPTDISYDNRNSLWIGAQGDKLYLQSGQFTSVLKTSQDISGKDGFPSGISWEGNHTPWIGFNTSKMFLTSGQFTSTIKTSQSIAAIHPNAEGISYDGTNTPWAVSASSVDKLMLQSGQFSSIVKTSEFVGGIDTSPVSISYTGTDTLWTGLSAQKLYLTSGQFTSTLKDSEAVGSIDTGPQGLDTDDVFARLNIDNSLVPFLLHRAAIPVPPPGLAFVPGAVVRSPAQPDPVPLIIPHRLSRQPTRPAGRIIGVVVRRGPAGSEPVEEPRLIPHRLSRQPGRPGVRLEGRILRRLGSAAEIAAILIARRFSKQPGRPAFRLEGVVVRRDGFSDPIALAPTIRLSRQPGRPGFRLEGRVVWSLGFSDPLPALPHRLSRQPGRPSVRLEGRVGRSGVSPDDSEPPQPVPPVILTRKLRTWNREPKWPGVWIKGFHTRREGVPDPDFVRVKSIDTPWIGSQNDKLYLQSGRFSSVVKTSQDVSATGPAPAGISWDGVNTPWIGSAADKLRLQSGQFSSVVKTSQDVGGIDLFPSGVSWDGKNTPWSGGTGDKLYLQSGQFTSILKTSLDVGGVELNPTGISYDGTNTPWVGAAGDKLYLQSGQFSSILKTSQSVGGIDTFPSGISWDGTNTPWSGNQADKLYLQSGQFSSVIKTSQDVSAIDTGPQDIETNDVEARLGTIFDPRLRPEQLRRWGERPNRPETQIKGRHYRRGERADDSEIPGPLPRLPHRFSLPTGRPKVRLDGQVVRRGGVPKDDIVVGPAPYRSRRDLREIKPDPSVLSGSTLRRIAKPPTFTEFEQTYLQRFRVADDSLAVYDLFVGEGGPPDFTASGQPVASSPTLPFSYTPPAPPSGDTTVFHTVIRETNKYGLVSFNINTHLVEMDSGGGPVVVAPSAPIDVEVVDGAPGFLRISAFYSNPDDAAPADKWAVFVDIGVDPDLDRSSGPDYLADMFVLDAGTHLQIDLGTFGPGTAHVIVLALRSDDSRAGVAPVVLHPIGGPIDLADGLTFGGDVYEQR